MVKTEWRWTPALLVTIVGILLAQAGVLISREIKKSETDSTQTAELAHHKAELAHHKSLLDLRDSRLDEFSGQFRGALTALETRVESRLQWMTERLISRGGPSKLLYEVAEESPPPINSPLVSPVPVNTDLKAQELKLTAEIDQLISMEKSGKAKDDQIERRRQLELERELIKNEQIILQGQGLFDQRFCQQCLQECRDAIQ